MSKHSLRLGVGCCSLFFMHIFTDFHHLLSILTILLHEIPHLSVDLKHGIPVHYLFFSAAETVKSVKHLHYLPRMIEVCCNSSQISLKCYHILICLKLVYNITDMLANNSICFVMIVSDK